MARFVLLPLFFLFATVVVPALSDGIANAWLEPARGCREGPCLCDVSKALCPSQRPCVPQNVCPILEKRCDPRCSSEVIVNRECCGIQGCCMFKCFGETPEDSFWQCERTCHNGSK